LVWATVMEMVKAKVTATVAAVRHQVERKQ
jgi:hypothetical protein